MADERFDRAIAAIDAANADDPNTIVVKGKKRPKELAHAEMVSKWVRRLRPGASDELRLAARAHHLRRWVTPRSSFPPGRSAYLRWRKQLHDQHASDVGEILAGVGYDAPVIERVQQLVRKQGNLAKDPDMQALEDALCLVFIETQLHDLAVRTEEDKTITIIQKTAKKMSNQALDLAVELDLSDEDRALLGRALSGSSPGR